MAEQVDVDIDALIDYRYRVLGGLGGGSNGDVYHVLDTHLNKEAAIKLLKPKAGQPATWDEAQALEQLSSEYLLPVYNADVVRDSDIRYLTTPLMMGGDLEKAARPFGVDPAKAVRWAQQAASGLARIHAEGMLHRDVKPGNIYLDDNDDVLLGDFGMAITTDSSGLAPADGTYATVAPEALSKNACSIATDVYSLAATAYYLLCGQYPNGPLGLSNEQRRDRILAGQFDKLGDVAPHVPQSLSQIVERSLSENPTRRASSPREFGNQLAGCRQHGRTWRRVVPHPGHDRCFEGGPKGAARAVTICVVPEVQRRLSIEITLDTGSRVRRHERQGIPTGRLSATIRSVVRELSR